MDDELSIYDSSDTPMCEKCNTEHVCKRCIKNTHVCTICGSLFYECDICGSTETSLAEIKRHQLQSKICKKAKFLTATSIEEEIKKFGKEDIERRYSQIIHGKQ
jgi:hypothetical protein